MIALQTKEAIAAKYKILQKEFDERGRRIWAAVEANSLGHGGVITVSQATGLAESTIRIGKREIGAGFGDHAARASRKIRRKGEAEKLSRQKIQAFLKHWRLWLILLPEVIRCPPSGGLVRARAN